MIKSMTGFGQDSGSYKGIKLQLELKSVNHRYCEIMVRMPREWLAYEDGLKKIIQQHVKRGRVDVLVTMEREVSPGAAVSINWSLAESCYQAAEQLKQRFGVGGSLTVNDLIQIPELLSFHHTNPEFDEGAEQWLAESLQRSLQGLLDMRLAEGMHLQADIADRLAVLDRLRNEILHIFPEIVIEHRDKLSQRIQDMMLDDAFDELRFAMEVALIADRANIDEELTRLHSHINQCRNLLEAVEPVGRKLDFLIQEMNREVNTIGSKANHTRVVNKVVDMKAELEKIREQVQNIE